MTDYTVIADGYFALRGSSARNRKSIIWSIVAVGLLTAWAIICGWKKRIMPVQVQSAVSGRSGASNSPDATPCAITSPMHAGNAFDMGDADVPVLLHRDRDHLVHLGIADIALRVHAIDGLEQLAQPGLGRTGLRHDPPRLDLDLAHQGAGHAFVDRLLRIEEAIDVGGAHPQFLGDVGDRRLLVADLPEQTLRHHEDALAGVGFDMFGD